MKEEGQGQPRLATRLLDEFIFIFVHDHSNRSWFIE